MRLTTLARVKTLANVTGVNFDPLINRLVSQVTGQVERYLGRYILKVARTIQTDIEPKQRVVWLRGYPIEAVPAAQFRSDTTRDFTNDAIDADNYFLNREDGYVEFDRYALNEGPGTFQSIYTGGLAYSFDRVQMTVTGQAGAGPTVGDTVTGATSGATGVFVSVGVGTPATLIVTVDQNGTFETSETVTSGAWSATLSTIDRSPLVVAYADIVQATEIQTAFDYQRRDEIGLQSVSHEGGSISLDAAVKLLPGVMQILDPHRSRAERW